MTTFSRHLHWTSCALIIIGFFAVLITGSYSIVSLVGILFTCIYWIWKDRPFSPLKIPTQVFNILVVILLAYLCYDSFFKGKDFLGNSILFVVILQIIRLIAPKSSREWSQIYALSFLHIVAATVITSQMSFVLPFLAYLLCATWALTLFSIQYQLENTLKGKELELERRSLDLSTNFIQRRFFVGTGLLLGVFLSVGLLIFFLFPRVSFRNYLKRASSTQNVSGFSNEIALGNLGSIKTNDNVVMRVEFSEDILNELDPSELYFRGTSADQFDGFTWKQEHAETNRISLDSEAPFINLPNSPIVPTTKRFTYSILMESLSTPLIFFLDGTRRIYWNKNIVEKVLRRSFFLETNPFNTSIGFVSTQPYLADLQFSGEAFLGDTQLSPPSTENLLKEDQESYLALPPLGPKVLEVLKNLNRVKNQDPKKHPMQTAQSIIESLQRRYQYTLDVQDMGQENPLEFFLTERKKGHCEYFATALAVALRYHGIPSRVAMGFRGGDVNHYGNYIAVRQKDAHSWVEAWINGGWRRLDPSPEDSRVSQESPFLKPVVHMFDYARLRWNKYIVEYDLKSQVVLAENIASYFTKKFKSSKADHETEQEPAGETKTFMRMNSAKHVFLYLLLISACGFAIWTWAQRREHRVRHGHYASIAKVLAKHGFERRPYETPEELARRITMRVGPIPELNEINRIYYDTTFGTERNHLSKSISLIALEEALKRSTKSKTFAARKI